MWMARLYPTYEPNTCLISNGLSTMAWTVPGAIAAKIACPQSKVLVATGDGAFLMNSQDLPEDGAAILVNGALAGRVTSARYSPAKQKPIGLGWVSASAAAEGATISQATDAGNFDLLLAATMIMAATVVTINRLVWRRLYALAETRYRLET